MTVTIQQIRTRIGDPLPGETTSILSDDDITLKIAIAEAYLVEQKKVPVIGILGEEAVRNRASITAKQDLLAMMGISAASEGGNSVQYRDAEITIAGWQKNLDEYIDSKRSCPLSVI